MTSETAIRFDRRRLITNAAASVAVVIAAPAIIGSARAQSKSITLVTWGGTYADALKKHWSGPFTVETGISVVLADGPDLAKLKAQTMMGRSEWDVVDAPGSMALTGTKEGYWAPIDRSILKTDHLTAAKTDPDRVGMYFFTGGIAWNPHTHPDGKHPTTFEEYFDLQGFPGRRTFRARISETLEMALVADGVSPKALYPLDIERGFRMLDKIKPSVTKWVEQTPQTVALLQNGEVDFTYTYLNRARAAQASNLPIDFSLKQTLNGITYFTVPKASPNKIEAMQFIAFCLRPDRQAALMEELSLIPNNPAALPLLSAASKAWMPDLDGPNTVILNDEWWSSNFDALQRRFQQWLLV